MSGAVRTDSDQVVECPARDIEAAGRPRLVTVYFILTFVLAWGAALLVAVVGPGRVPATPDEFRPYLPYAMLAAFAAPAVAGMLLTGLTDGRAGLRRLLRRLGQWRMEARWYAFAVLTAPLVVLAVLLPLSLVSDDFLPAVFTSDGTVTLLLIGIAAGVAAGFLEELGWTGFAIPRLRSRHGVVATGLLVGFVWGAWHFSYFVMRGSPSGGLDLGLFLPEAVGMFLVVLPAYRVLLVLLYDRTDSLPVTMLMHASLSASTAVILAPDVAGTELAVYYLAVGALLWAVVGAVVWAGRRADRRATSVRLEHERSWR